MVVVEREKLYLTLVKSLVRRQSLVIATSLDTARQNIITVSGLGKFWPVNSRSDLAGNFIALDKC
jgi:hypothetical protein